jgi:hypothetical protein
MEKKTKLVTLVVYVVFWIAVGKLGMLSTIYSINTYTYDVHLLWRALGILLAALYLVSIFWNKAKWGVLLVASPLVIIAAIKTGYMGWLGYFYAFNNDILHHFLISLSALAMYGLLLSTSVELKKEVGVTILLILIGSSAVAYEPAKNKYRESTSNQRLWRQ